MGRRRIVAERVLTIFLEYEGQALRFKDIKLVLKRKGWSHPNLSIINNLNWLIEQEKIVRFELNKEVRYGIPKNEGDGSSYLRAYSPFYIKDGVGGFEEKYEFQKEIMEEWVAEGVPIKAALLRAYELQHSGTNPSDWTKSEQELVFSMLNSFEIPLLRGELASPSIFKEKFTREQIEEVLAKDRVLLEKLKEALEEKYRGEKG